MPNNKELELERRALLLDMAGKINVIYDLLTRATIGTEPEGKKSERKNSKKAKKSDGV